MTTQQIDAAKAEAFGGQIIEMMNGAMLSLMTSVGHRTGLFDKMAEMPPSTTDENVEGDFMNAYYICSKG